MFTASIIVIVPPWELLRIPFLEEVYSISFGSSSSHIRRFWIALEGRYIVISKWNVIQFLSYETSNMSWYLDYPRPAFPTKQISSPNFVEVYVSSSILAKILDSWSEYFID